MIRRRALFPVDAERLWRELTEPEATEAWMGGRLEWDLNPGGAVRFSAGEATRRGEIDEVVPGRRLRFRWWPEGEGPDGGPGASEVVYDLRPEDSGTELTVTERRLSPVETTPGDTRADQGAGTAGRPPEALSSAAAAPWTRWDGLLLGTWAWATATAPCRA